MSEAMNKTVDFDARARLVLSQEPLLSARDVKVTFSLRGNKLTAKAACRKDGKTSCVYQVDVTDDLGRDVAQAVVTGFKL